MGLFPAFALRVEPQSSLSLAAVALQSGAGCGCPMPREYPYPPRMMVRPRAAHYCDLGERAFGREVEAGRLPPPVMLGGREHWSRLALDEYLARIAGETAGDWRKDQPLYAA